MKEKGQSGKRHEIEIKENGRVSGKQRACDKKGTYRYISYERFGDLQK
jgi:hypothetical protein